MPNSTESEKSLATAPHVELMYDSDSNRIVQLGSYKLVKAKKKGKSVTKQIPSQALTFVGIPAGDFDFDFEFKFRLKKGEKPINATKSNLDEVQQSSDTDASVAPAVDPDVGLSVEANANLELGSDLAINARKTKKPRKVMVKTKIRIEPFEMATTPITQGVWKYVMGFNPSYYQKKVVEESVPNKKTVRIEKDLNRPVENITWFDAISFCNKLSVLEGLDPYYNMTNIKYDDNDGNFKFRVLNAGEESLKKRSRHIIYAQVTRNTDSSGYRLPTVAEHELLSKKASEKKKEKGLSRDPKATRSRFESINLYTEPVGSGKPNALGLYDLNSNVYEMLYDYDVTLADSLKSERGKLDKNNPYNFLRGSTDYECAFREFTVNSKEDSDFLAALTILDNPVIEPKTQPSMDDFVAHCVAGNTSYGAHLDKSGFYFERDGIKLAGKYTEAQFSRDPKVGFRIVRTTRHFKKREPLTFHSKMPLHAKIASRLIAKS